MRRTIQLGMLLVGLLRVSGAARVEFSATIEVDRATASNAVLLAWEAIPNQLYQVEQVQNLANQQWEPLGDPIRATNNFIRVRDTREFAGRFYRVAKFDTEAPELWRANPHDGAFAVRRQGPITAVLSDETGVDPASVVFTLGSQAPVAYPDPRLAVTNSTVVYTPAAGEVLGGYGENVSVTLVAADPLGHRATNSWAFELEWQPVLAANVTLITPDSPLRLVSSEGDRFVFAYTGLTSGLTNGHIVVGTDPAFPFKRTVTGVTEDPVARTVTLETAPASLADLLEEGSIRLEAVDFVEATGQARPAGAAESDGVEIPLTGLTLLREGNAKVEVAEGRFAWDPDFTLAARLRQPRSFDLEVSTQLKFDLVLGAGWDGAVQFDDSRQVGRKYRKFLGFIPTAVPIPVWAEVVTEFRVGLEGALEGRARIAGGFTYSNVLALGIKLRDGQWDPYARYHSEAQVHPVTWEAAGSGRLQAYLQPRVTVFLESLVGPSIDLKPYLELTGTTCSEPGREGVDASLAAGVSSTVALNIRAWNEEWGALPTWEVFNVRKELWHGRFGWDTGPKPTPIANMVWIPCGSFTMGSTTNEPGGGTVSESPLTHVTLSQGFWMGRFEVTQAEYLALMGVNPSTHLEPGNLRLPVEYVTWNEAMAYCAALTERERAAGRLLAGFEYRLPTEAQWEYACRAGTTTAFHYGNELRSTMANFNGRLPYPPVCMSMEDPCYAPDAADLRTQPVGSYAPNAWGLFDMHGNVREMCLDFFDFPTGGRVIDPRGPATGSYHVTRGGSARFPGYYCRSADRHWYVPADRRDYKHGFRLVLVRAD